MPNQKEIFVLGFNDTVWRLKPPPIEHRTAKTDSRRILRDLLPLDTSASTQPRVSAKA